MNNKYLRTTAVVDLNAIVHNLTEVKGLIRPGTKLMVIIKANAYGHGAVPVALRLEKENIADAYGVATVDEGVELRSCGIKRPILLLGYTAEGEYEAAAENDLTISVFSREMAEAYSSFCESVNIRGKVNIKLDTGMGRIGFAPSEEAKADILAIGRLKGIEITGIFSHMARADEKDKSSAIGQFELFKAFTAELEAAGLHIPVRHISNSAAIMELPQMNLDMVRSGIITYGYYPSEEVDKSKIDLIPAMSWYSHVSFVKTVPAGTPISYGGTFVSDRSMRIATVPVGYADGYSRQLSNKGSVIIRGRRARILGRICMDQFMVDVTGIDGVSQGDKVTLIGRDGDEYIPVEEPAGLSGSFNYEFTCDVGQRVPRTYI